MVILNAKEFLKDLTESGFTKEESFKELKAEIAKRKISSAKGEKFYNDHVEKDKQACINFK